jgi:site-specific DNA-methyltransferase (adenine-specific)
VSFRLLAGDCRAALAELPICSVDAVISDPPYGIGFMRKSWDSSGVETDPETWVAVRHVMKPGAYLAAFGGTRTFHRLTCAIEDAGLEIHDCCAWLYGSGYPKHVSKLKPAWEPIVLARKPADRASPLNIADCAIPFVNAADEAEAKEKNRHADFGTEPGGNAVCGDYSKTESKNYDPGARWPANVLLDEEAAAALDASTGDLAAGNRPAVRNVSSTFQANAQGETGTAARMDAGGPSRFFYCAKASREERETGLEGFTRLPLRWSSGDKSPGTFQSAGTDKTSRNPVPTVKPVSLMKWLVRLITPAQGVVLDPFAGSGTTGVAAIEEGFDFIGCELDDYTRQIAEARCVAAQPSLFGAS